MEWLLYLLKASACMALFYTLYHFFLRPLTFFSFNRFYLLSTLVISFLIPALQLEIERQVEVQQEVQQETPGPSVESLVAAGPLNRDAFVVKDPVPVSTSGLSAYNWQEIVNVVYWLIAAATLGIFAYQTAQLLKHIAHVNKRVGRLKIVYKSTGFTNCSFLNYVFVDQPNLTEEEITVILQHEAVHANKRHSMDKLFVNICKVFLWFNPLIYLYAQALEQMHEYEADQEASSIIGSASYANLLLAIAVRNNNPPLVHSFVKSPLKARIEMLFTNPSQHMKKLMYLAVLPLLSVLLWSFSVAYIDKPLTQKTAKEVDYKAAEQAPKDSVKYRQKVKRTPEMEKGRAEIDAWLETEDFKNKAMFSRSMRGKQVEVMVKGESEQPFGSKMLYYVLVEYQNKDYYLSCDLPTGAEKIKGLVKAGDRLDVEVYGLFYSREKMMNIEGKKIVKDGRLIYEKKMPKIDPNAKPAPFLFEANRVRFNDGVITKAGSVVAGKRNMEVSANGFKFLIKINSNQVDLSELASFKQGDKVSLRFVHEVKTGPLTYSMTDWVSISKKPDSYDVKNKQMFYRFYEKVPVRSKVTDGRAGIMGIEPSALKSKIIVDDKKEDVKINSQTLAKMEYMARDSVKYSKDKKIIDLYRKAKLSLDSAIITADRIQINNHSNFVTAFNAQLSLYYKGLKINAKTIYYDFKTKRILTNPTIETTD